MTVKRIALFLVLLIAVLGAGALAWAMRYPAITPIARPDPASFDPALVARGEELAGFGNCSVCHTRQGGGRYSGGMALPTPFGTIYSTNITPDPETGIGTWSQEAFVRAMQHGVDRDGQYLYPAFPYDYYTRVTEEDLVAIYSYIMTRDPVSYTPPENELPFPFNVRLSLAGWNLLFLDRQEFQPDPAMSDDWNRGAYLVEGLGHCGACHSPRNILGAAAKSGPNAYGGSHAEGWYIPPLNASAPGLAPWSEISMVNYLIDGWDANHGIAAGPMTPVVNDLYEQDEDDIFAMAEYLLWLRGGELPQEEREARTKAAWEFAERVEWGSENAPPVPDDPQMQLGARVFERECAECHRLGGKPTPLALGTTVHAPDAANLMYVSLHGIQPPPRGVLDRSMPARHLQISDDEMVALSAFVRDRFSELPPWEGMEDLVKQVRAERH